MTGSYFNKKIILILALMAFVIGGSFPIQEAGAAAIFTTPGTAANPNSSTISTGGTNKNITSDPQTGKAVVTEVSAPSSEKSGEIYCVKPTTIAFSLSPEGCIAWVAFKMLQIASWVLWVAAIVFDKTLSYTLNMAGFLKDIPIVALGWATFRDVTNLMFVFIILYIAINTIVGNEGYGIKKLLGKVIVGAMLINFSLFFTQVMIDASNIFALQFYHRITVDAAGQNISSGTAENNSDGDAGISAAFVNAMGLQQIYFLGKGTQEANTGESSVDLNDINGSTKLGLNAGNLIIVGIGGTILVLITAFVFFAATFMFFARTLVLVFLMILSPIAFMGNILPALGKYTGEWWSRLTSNLLFAPVYMMMFYLVMSMIIGKGEKFTGVNGASGNFADMFAGGTGWTGTVMTFVVLIGLMLGCLMIASKLGVIGGKWAESKGTGFAKGLGLSLTGASLAVGGAKYAGNFGLGIGRNTAGRIGTTLAENKFLARMSTKPGFGRLAAYTMQKGDDLKGIKIGGESFNEKVKGIQKNYTKRGNLIETALADYKDDPNLTPAQNKANKERIVKAAAKKEEEYLGKSRFSYAKKAAIKKAAKAAKGTDNKEALDALLSGKWSQDEHNKAKIALEDTNGVDARLKALHIRIEKNGLKLINDPTKEDPASLAVELSSLTQQKHDLNTIIKGHLDTVGKRSALD